MAVVPAFPIVNPDGTWDYTFLPNVTVNAGDVPAQASGITYAGFNLYGQGAQYSGAVEAHHITNIPPIMPNVGIPLTNLNAQDWMRGNANNVIAKALQVAGHDVIAVVMYEYAVAGSFLGVSTTLLGYEFEIIVAAPAAGQVDQAAAGFIITVPLLIAGFTAAAALIAWNLATNGAVFNAIGQMLDHISSGIAKVAAAPFQGAAWLLIGAAAALGVGAVVISRSTSAASLKSASEIARGASAVTGAVTRATPIRGFPAPASQPSSSSRRR